MSSSDSTAGSDFELVHDTHLLDNLSRVSVNHTEQAEGTCGDIFTFSIPTTSISGSSSYSGHNNSDSSADTLNHRKPSIATTTTTTTTTVTTIATAVSESESESETETETEAETGSERITTSEMNRTTQSTISNNALIATDNKSKQLSPSDKNDKSQNADADCCDPFCAICLDRIQPRHHAKGTLACRHEFHLSCISMAFSMSKDMVCPLCRYVHKDQPFMNLDSEDDIKPTSTTTATTTMSTMTTSSIHYRRLFQRPQQQQQQQQQHHPFSHPPPTLSSMSTLHEHPTSGTILSMMPSLFEASIGHGPTAGTIRTSPDGIFLKTSTWLLLYAMPFTVALCFLAFVLGKVETMWSKVSCLIGAAICYMVCWGLVVAIMDPDHEARAILNRLNEMQEQQQQQQQVGSITNMSINTRGSSSMSVSSGSDNNVHDSILTASTIRNVDNDTISETLYESRIDPAIDTSTFDLNLASLPGSSSSSGPPTLDVPQDFSWTEWVHQIYTQVLQNRVKDLAAILDDIPDMMGEW